MPDKERKEIIAGYFQHYKAIRKTNKPKTKTIDESVCGLYSDQEKNEIEMKVRETVKDVSSGQAVNSVPPEAAFQTAKSTVPESLTQLTDTTRELEAEANNPTADPKKTISLTERATKLANTVGNDIQQYSYVQLGEEDGLALGRIGMMSDGLRNVVNSSVAVVGAALSCMRAEQMQNVNYWLGHELLNRYRVGEKLKELEKLRIILGSDGKDKTLIMYTDDELKEVEEKLFLKKEIEKNQHRSLLKYREKLQEGVERLDSTLLNEERETINLIVQLEMYHGRRKIQLLEEAISVRLDVKRASGEMDNKTAHGIISKYHDQSLYVKSLLKKTDPANPITANPSKAEVKLNDQIESKLHQTAVKKRKDMVAKTLLFVSAALAIACIASAIFMPPSAPLLIGLAVGALVALAIAKLMKPDISKVFTQGGRKFSDNYKEEVGFWKAKKQMKELQASHPTKTLMPDPVPTTRK